MNPFANSALAFLDENSSITSFAPFMQQEPIPTLAKIIGNHVPLHLTPLLGPLDQISIALPYSVALFNRKYFWETHEVLEDLWMDEYGSIRPFLQGFIQAAAAMYHVVAQNPSGYERLSRLSREKLATFKTPQLGVDLKSCVAAFSVFDQQIADELRFDLTKLPKITFAGLTL